jgi:hypothetical protein
VGLNLLIGQLQTCGAGLSAHQSFELVPCWLSLYNGRKDETFRMRMGSLGQTDFRNSVATPFKISGSELAATLLVY